MNKLATLAPKGAVERSRWNRIAPLMLVFAASFTYLAPDAFRPLGNLYDEGIAASGGYRILRGEAPYRDFWTWYAPGEFYEHAALFRLFGPSLMAVRLTDTVLRSMICCAVFLLATTLARTGWAIAAAVATAIWLGDSGTCGYNGVTAILPIAVCTWQVSRFIDLPGGGARPLVAAGIWCGIAGLIRHDACVYCAVVCLCVMTAFQILARRRKNEAARRKLLTCLAAFIGGAGLIIVPLLALCLHLAPAKQLYNDMVRMPPQIMGAYRAQSLPLPFAEVRLLSELPLKWWVDESIQNLQLWFPILAVAGAAGWAASVVTSRADDEGAKGWRIALICAMSASMLALGGIRADLAHLLPATILVFPILAGAAETMLQRGRRLACMILAGFCSVLILPPGFQHVRRVRDLFARRPEIYAYDLPRARGIGVPLNYAALVRFVDKHVAPPERLYVGFLDHRRVFVGDEMLNFLTNRLSPTRILDQHPGVITTRPVQLDVIAELERDGVGWLVLQDLSRLMEQSQSATQVGRRDGLQTYLLTKRPRLQPLVPTEGSDTLDVYIRRNYQQITRLGNYTVWQRMEKLRHEWSTAGGAD